MKTPSDELFLLIKALSPSEKRYFRTEVIAREKGANTAYYKLFDAIDKQEVYDEDELLKKYPDEKFARHFAMAKKYLFDSLLRTLNTYHRNSDSLRDLHDKLTSAMILHSKGLYAMSKKMFRTVKKTAEEQEAFQLLSQALYYELRHLVPNTTLNHAEELQELYREQQRVHDILRLDTDFVYLQEKSVSIHLASTYSRGDNSAIDELLAHPLLDENHPPEYRTHRVKYHATIGRLYFIRGDYEKAYLHTKACVEAIEQLPYRMRSNYIFYLTQLHNLFGRSLKAKKYDELEIILQKIRAVPTGSTQVQKFRYESLYTLELNYHILMHNYERAYALIPEIE